MLPHDTYGRDWGLFIGEKAEKILGSNVSGIIESTGPGVTSFEKGDRVFGLSNYHGPQSDQAGLQQYAILDVSAIAKPPVDFTDEQVVTLPVNIVTSWMALFTKSGFGFPAPFAEEGKAFDYAARTIVIIGAGSNVGKFAVQLAATAGIGKTIAIAGAANKDALTTMGATHFIDRRDAPEDITKQVNAAAGPNGATHVYDCVNMVADSAITVLSTSQPSMLRSLLPIEGEEGEKLKSQRPQCDAQMVHCANDDLSPNQEAFWAHVPKWLQEGKLLPTEFRVIEGLEKVNEINAALDGYRDMDRSGAKQVIVRV